MTMNHSSKIGFSFGTTSGIITTLGLIVGLTASDASKAVIIGGVLTIAFADAFSDALGIHTSEESENTHSEREIWISTFATYFTKLIIALTFLFPLIFLSSTVALIVSIVWAILLLTILNYIISPKEKKWQIIFEHLLISLVVIIFGFIIGQYIRSVF
jgi:VIT1/CCC1 family predicted Fe2+/Mn2+ transporter